MMRKNLLNKKLMIRSSLAVWAVGLVAFVVMTFPDLMGTAQYILASLFENTEPSIQSTQAAGRTLLKLLGGLLLCIVGQLLIFVCAASLLGSKEAIDFYHDREKDYLDVLEGRIDLAKQITKFSNALNTFNSDLNEDRKIQTEMRRDIKMLCEVIEITKDSLPVYYRERPTSKDKGDF